MKERVLKRWVRKLCFPHGAVRRIAFGPLRGFRFRVSDITGLEAWYSSNQRDVQGCISRLVRPGETVVDVGANWGVHTLLLSRQVGPQGQVLAIEPLPRANAELQWHLQTNACHNVQALNVAVSDQNGEAWFEEEDSASKGHLSAEPGDRPSKSFRVTTRTLDSLLEEHGVSRLSLVKVDVEGAESAVLRGARRTLSDLRPRLIVDLHTPEQDVAVARILKEHNYRPCRMDGSPILHPENGWPDPEGLWGGILAVPNA